MKDPNYAPVYCALYPGLAEVTRAHGYALAIHGSLGRDMDLICVPWVDEPSEPAAVVEAITSKFAIKAVGGPPTLKAHGREAWTISVAFGECAIDLSFMPRTQGVETAPTPKPERAFPLMGYRLAVPWSLLAPHEQQAMKNHGQTLERLAERGGLSPLEAVCVINGLHFREVHGRSNEWALQALKGLLGGELLPRAA